MKNRLVKASFYKKEGSILWIMYCIFFSIGYLYGNAKMGIGFPLIFFGIMLLIIFIVGKPSKEIIIKRLKNANKIC